MKLSLRLLFGISNILSLGWGNSKTHFSERKKNVDGHESTQQKNRKKKKKSRAKNGLLKKSRFQSKQKDK